MEDRDTLVEQLQLLGLTQYESEVYVTLLGRPSFTASEVAAESGVPRQRVYDVLERLCGQGLATELRDARIRTFTGVEPAIALRTWLEHERRELEETYTKQSAYVQELIPTLDALLSSERDLDSSTTVLEQIGDALLFTNRISDTIDAAGSGFDRMSQLPFLVSLEEQLRQIESARSREVRVRALYDRAATTDRAILAYLQLFRENGAEIRLADTLPASLYVIDGSRAWIAVRQSKIGEQTHAMFSVRHHGFVELLQAAFEQCWQQATPLS